MSKLRTRQKGENENTTQALTQGSIRLEWFSISTFWIKMSALDGGAVWLVGSLSPPKPPWPFLSSVTARRKVLFLSFQKSLGTPAFSTVGITKSPFKTTLVTCQLSQAGLLGLYSQHIHSHVHRGWLPAPSPIYAHIPYIHRKYIDTDTTVNPNRTHTHAHPLTHAHTLKPHVWELLL